MSATPRPATAAVFAYHDVGVRCLTALLEAGVEVPLVVTHRDDPGETIWFASVADLAARHGLRTACAEDVDQAWLLRELRSLKPDFLFSFYYRRMLPPEKIGRAHV